VKERGRVSDPTTSGHLQLRSRETYGSALDVGLRLVGDLHQVLGARVDHVAEDVGVDNGAEVVDVRDKEVLLAGGDELVDQARVVKGVKDVAVARGVPVGCRCCGSCTSG
jgi:hypothetical protein